MKETTKISLRNHALSDQNKQDATKGTMPVFIGIDLAKGKDETACRCPNCGTYHKNLPNWYCAACSDKFKKRGNYSYLDENGLKK